MGLKKFQELIEELVPRSFTYKKWKKAIIYLYLGTKEAMCYTYSNRDSEVGIEYLGIENLYSEDAIYLLSRLSVNSKMVSTK